MGSAGSSRARRSVWAGSARNAARNLSVSLTSPPTSVLCRRAWRRSRSMRQSARLVWWNLPPTSNPHPSVRRCRLRRMAGARNCECPAHRDEPPARALTAAGRSAYDAGSLRGHQTAAKWKPGCCGQRSGRPNMPRSRRAPHSDRDMTSSHQANQAFIPESIAAPRASLTRQPPHSNDPTTQDTKHQIMIQPSQTNHTSPLQQPPTTHDTRHRTKHPDPTITDQTTIEPRHLLRSNSIPTTTASLTHL